MGVIISDWVAADDKYDLFQFVYRSHNQSKDFTPFRNAYTGDWDTFPGTWFDVQPGGCYDKQNLDNATCASSMGCAKSQDWLPTDVAAYAKTVVSSHLYTHATFLPR